MDIDWIRKGLEKAGKTQKGLAEALQLDPSQVTRILKNGRRLRADEIEKVRLYLDESIPSERKPNQPAPPTVIGDMPRDVPVEGTAAGGPDGAFVFEGGTIDYLRRPPRLAGIPGVYGLYILGDSMSPWRRNGEPVYVHPGQPPQITDRVVVQCGERGTPSEAFIKELVRRTATELRLRQYTPEKELILPTKRVLSIHRIIDWPELMGI